MCNTPHSNNDDHKLYLYCTITVTVVQLSSSVVYKKQIKHKQIWQAKSNENLGQYQVKYKKQIKALF